MSLIANHDEDNKFVPSHIDAFLTALQDPGKRDDKDKARLIKYSKLEKYCGNIVKLWNDKKFEGIPKNVTHCKKAICKLLIMKRNLVDASSVDQKFRKHANEQHQLFILSNTDDAGFSIIIPLMRSHWSSNAAKRQENRSPADAIRLAAVMLKPDQRSPVSQFLSRKKSDRAMHDQANNIDLALFETLLQTFKDSSFVVERPELMDTDKHDPKNKINPNDDENWDSRDAKWLINTWFDYLKPVYRQTLLKWYKNTGGGPRTDNNFHNYCIGGKTWLTWVYLLDKKSHLLLATGSGGKVPDWLKNEAGFVATDQNQNDDDFIMHSTHQGDDSSDDIDREEATPSKLAVKKKISSAEKSLQTIRNSQKKINQLTNEVASLLDSKKRAALDLYENLMQDMMKQNEYTKEIQNDNMHSPETRDTLLKIVKKRKKDISQKIINLDENEQE